MADLGFFVQEVLQVDGLAEELLFVLVVKVNDLDV